MTSEDRDTLRRLLAKRLSKAEKETVESDGVVPESTLSDLTRLARLAEIGDTLKNPPRRQQWPVAVAVVLTLSLASILLFTHVSRTEIDLQVLVSEVELGFSDDRPWTDALQLSSLGVSGLDSVVGPFDTDPTTRSSIRLAVAEGTPSAQLTLAPIFLPAKSRVWLRASDLPGSCRMSIQSKDLRFRADVIGQINVTGVPSVQTYKSPRAFLLNGGTREAAFDLTFLDKEQNPFVQHLPLQAISMSSVERYTEGSRMLARRVSSVISGTLYYESLGGSERKLRRGETLEITPSDGVLERVAVADGTIALHFHGIVKDMRAGDDGHTNLMPTSLEWLHARHGLSLMWGAAVYLLGVVMGVMRWAGARV